MSLTDVGVQLSQASEPGAFSARLPDRFAIKHVTWRWLIGDSYEFI